MEGTSDPAPGPETNWQAYEFKCKPGDIGRIPCLMSPYHYRLDWLMWFAAMSDFRYHPWILNLIAKLLQNDPSTLSLLKTKPFPDSAPQYIRAEYYRCHFTDAEERKKTGRHWKREKLSVYLPPLSLDLPDFRKILEDQKWL